MKKIVVCGDSFYCPDPDYPGHWTEHVKDCDVVSLAHPGASNLLIRIQVEKAIKMKPDLIVVGFTSCYRLTVKFKDGQGGELLDRFFKTVDPKEDADLVSLPSGSLWIGNVLNDRQQQLLKEYTIEFMDLDLDLEHNYYLIQGTLDRLINTGIKFAYSQGGFDHPSYGQDRTYDFGDYKKYEVPNNLWDHYDIVNEDGGQRFGNSHEPSYHIREESVHKNLAEHVETLCQ